MTWREQGGGASQVLDSRICPFSVRFTFSAPRSIHSCAFSSVIPPPTCSPSIREEMAERDEDGEEPRSAAIPSELIKFEQRATDSTIL